MSFIDLEEFKEISTLSLSDSDDLRLGLYVSSTNGLLSIYNYDETIEGFVDAMKVVAVAIIESMYYVSQRQTVMAANRPFKSERIGSYSYQRYDIAGEEDVFQRLPGSVLSLWMGFLVKPEQIAYTTHVFKELPPDGSGNRDWHSYSDAEFSRAVY